MSMDALAHSYMRFSSKRQENGDSIRRQTSLRDKWLETTAVKLSDLQFNDLGVSGFKGANRHTGALSEFIRLAEEGVEVMPGDYLLIEQLDRLSRQTAYKAIALVEEIVEHGIRIVDLDVGGRVTIIDKASLNANPYLLVELVLKFVRAHEESQTKSKRTLEAREVAMLNLRTKGTPIRQRLPAWIVKGENGKLELDPLKAASMRKMIALAMDGMGAMSIAATLNREGVLPVSDRYCTTNWEYSTVQFYLRSRILIGEYQPTEVKAGTRRVPSGLPIENYYPRLLADAEFYKLQAILDRRAVGKRQGREGKHVANIFGRLLVNGFDGGTMTLVQKRAENVNLVSMKAQRGLANRCTFPYPIFERAFLRWVAEIDVSNRRGTRTSKLDERLGRLSSVVHKIETIETRMSEADESVYERLSKELARLASEESILKREIHEEKIEAAAPNVTTAEVVSIAAQLKAAKGDELTALRSRLRLAISTMVERIDLFPCVGSWSHVRHAGAVVKLRNGLIRSYELRVERGKTPLTTCDTRFNPSSTPDFMTDDEFRKLVGRAAEASASMSYDEFKAAADGGTVIAIPWG